MKVFREDKTLTFKTNLEMIRSSAKVGDIYIDNMSTYKRVDMRLNKGFAWVLCGESRSLPYISK